MEKLTSAPGEVDIRIILESGIIIHRQANSELIGMKVGP